MATKTKKVSVPPKVQYVEINGVKREAKRVMVVGPTGKRRFEWQAK